MSEKEETNCPICNSKAYMVYTELKGGSAYECSRCGKFSIESRFSSFLINNEIEETTRIKISSWVYEHQGIYITVNDYEFLIGLENLTLTEKGMKLLQYLASENPISGKTFLLSGEEFSGLFFRRQNNKDIYLKLVQDLKENRKSSKYLAISWSYDYDEFCFILLDFLVGTLGYIEVKSWLNEWSITPVGWNVIDEHKKKSPYSTIAFVAMWFDDKTNDAYNQAIVKAINEAGYTPLRIDKHEHLNKIDDEIIVGIKKSKFLVCDFTGQRGGVYFEAGYALGLGLPVIWTCNASDLKNVHFDNRQYNFLLWEEDKLEDFKKALQNRIEATIGKPS